MVQEGYGFSDEEVSVGRVHFGIVIAAETYVPEIIGKDLEIAQGGFKSAIELERMLADPDIVVEPWTRLAAPVLTKYLDQFPPF